MPSSTALAVSGDTRASTAISATGSPCLALVMIHRALAVPAVVQCLELPVRRRAIRPNLAPDNYRLTPRLVGVLLPIRDTRTLRLTHS